MSLRSFILSVFLLTLFGCASVNLPTEAPLSSTKAPIKYGDVNGGVRQLPTPGIGTCPPGEVVNRLLPNVGPPQGCTSSVNLNVNNVINVMAPPYNAKGDGTTDDIVAIQDAIYDACNIPNRTPVSGSLYTATRAVYLPVPPNCYEHSAPLRIPCQGLEFFGQGGEKVPSGLCQNYYGPAVLMNAWGGANLPTAASIVPGPGFSLPVAIDNPDVVDVSRFANANNTNTFADSCIANGSCSIEFFVKPTSGSENGLLLSSFPAYPGTGSGMFSIAYPSALTPQVTINLVSTGVHTFGACSLETSGTVYFIGVYWSGTAYSVWHGVPGGTATQCGGTFSSTEPFAQSKFEEIMLAPHGNSFFWPVTGPGGNQQSMVGNLDSIRFSSIDREPGGAFTIPSVKFAYDGSTYFLTNFEQTLDGTVLGYTAFGDLVYLPVTGTLIGYTSSAYIHDLELCSNGNGDIGNKAGIDGLWAAGSNNSIFQRLHCSNANYMQFDFVNNDYLAIFKDSGGYGGHGTSFGGAWNAGETDNNQYDNSDVTGEVYASENHIDRNTKVIDRGTLQYGVMDFGSLGSIYDFFVMDQETGNTAFVAPVLLYDPSDSVIFHGGAIASNNGSPYIQQDFGGAGFQAYGMVFGAPLSTTPSEIVDCTNGTPNTPDQLLATTNPVGVPPSSSVTACPVNHDPGCRGFTTLVSGAGTFSSQCIFRGDVCSATAAHSTTAAQPTAGRNITATIAFNGTTMTDSAASFTSADVGRLILGNGNVPAGTTITVIGSSSSVTISASAGVHVAPQSVTLAASTVLAGTGTDVVTTVCQ